MGVVWCAFLHHILFSCSVICITGEAFLDGCFLRAKNHSLFDEFMGPDAEAVCGNSAQEGQKFQDSAMEVVLDTVLLQYVMVPRQRLK